MRVTKQTRDAHRAAILAEAGRLFRRDGYAGVGVAEITAAAGLTHGGFYGHFPSKDALAAEACRVNLTDGAANWRRRAALGGIEAVVRGYISERHRDKPETGCVLAALGPEAARAGPPLAEALADGTEALLDVLTDLLAARPDPRATALAMLATMTGGLILARALAADPLASRAALDAATAAALALSTQG